MQSQPVLPPPLKQTRALERRRRFDGGPAESLGALEVILFVLDQQELN
jgi:hypothetical protein